MKIKDRPLNKEERAEMREGIAAGMKRVGVPAKSSPDIIQQAIKKLVDKLSRRFSKLSEDEAEEALWGLASLWGDSAARELGWDWVIMVDGRDEWHAIASPNRAYVVYPFHFMHEVLAEPDTDQTSLLLYNMLKAGDLPKSKPGNFLNIG